MAGGGHKRRKFSRFSHKPAKWLKPQKLFSHTHKLCTFFPPLERPFSSEKHNILYLRPKITTTFCVTAR